MSRLRDLYESFGQSPWLDNLRRDWIHDGTLARFIDDGVRGVTSNPTIFQKAIESGGAYDEQFSKLSRQGLPTTDIYWELVVTDIRHALGALAPVYEASDGEDGFVSVEVAPSLAHDTAGTIAAARQLHELIERPNLYVKIPGTAEGVDAIRTMLSEGRSINVTLLFGLERYGDVIDAYLAALEERAARGADVSRVRSVASFFVSRVDTEVDRRLDAIGTPEAVALKGKAAVANAQAAYRLFRDRFSGPRWEALVARGAKPQRPLWASTSTKNPSYPDTLYVDELIGPDSVNTMPEATIAAFEDHGTLQRTVDADPQSCVQVLDALRAVGIDMADVASVLEHEGVASFSKSFDELLASLDAKASASRPGRR